MSGLITVPTLEQGLTSLGVLAGGTYLVHCKMSAFGPIQGGAQSLLEALQKVIGPQGNLVMPTFTSGRFDPSEWGNPPVPESLWHRYRFEVPLYDPSKTPVDVGMSRVYELFRTWPGVQRSAHPHSSFAAWGADAQWILADHQLDNRFGETSPLARLYDRHAQVLFLGTDHSTNTSFHLGEYRQPAPPVRQYSIVQAYNGTKRLAEYTDVDTNSSIFAQIGADFEMANPGECNAAQVGRATCRRFTMRSLVDFASNWLADNQ